MSNSNENSDKQKHRNDDHYASQQRYRIELEEQIKNNRIAKDRLKNEDIASGRAADLRSHFQHGQDNNEAEARHQKNLQYSRDLKVQIASNELRKQKNIEVESNAIWTGNNDYFSGMDEEKIELEKKQKQIETKEGLDRMIEEKAKLEQLEKDEEKRYREEMEELRNSLQKQELRSAKLEKERSLKLQQEFQESSKKIKDEIRKREVEINAAAEKEREEWFNRESNQIKHLRTAQNQLCSDVCDEWKHQIDSHKQKKENEQSQKQEDQLKSKMWNDMLYDEEEMKRQAKKEQNMQYQRDLMEQMKSDQKRKYY